MGTKSNRYDYHNELNNVVEQFNSKKYTKEQALEQIKNVEKKTIEMGMELEFGVDIGYMCAWAANEINIFGKF